MSNNGIFGLEEELITFCNTIKQENLGRSLLERSKRFAELSGKARIDDLIRLSEGTYE